MRLRSATRLADFIEQYCWRHYQQVWAAIFGEQLADHTRNRGHDVSSGRLPEMTMASTSIYCLFTAVTALKSMSHFNTWVQKKRRITPLEGQHVVAFATEIVEGALKLTKTDAIGVVQHALELMPGFESEIASVANLPNSTFDNHLRTMGYRYSRQLLLYCAATKTADHLLDAWLAEPRRPPEPEIEAAALYASLIRPEVAKHLGEAQLPSLPPA